MNEDLDKAEELKLLHLKHLCDSKTCPYCIADAEEAKHIIKKKLKKVKVK